MIRNEVIHKMMKDMVTYLSPYQLEKLKSTLQDKFEDFEINLILDKEKLSVNRSSKVISARRNIKIKNEET